MIITGLTFNMDRPHGRNSSHHLRKEMQTDWNKLVDAYIAEGNDSRGKEEIERLAKVGSGNGALFRRCEGANCGNVEETGVKFDCCANCKFVSLYTSATSDHLDSYFNADCLLQPFVSKVRLENSQNCMLLRRPARAVLTLTGCHTEELSQIARQF
jgi:hypothetical protein